MPSSTVLSDPDVSRTDSPLALIEEAGTSSEQWLFLVVGSGTSSWVPALVLFRSAAVVGTRESRS